MTEGSMGVVRESGSIFDLAESELDLSITDLQRLARAFQYRDYRRYRAVDGRADQHLLVSSILEELAGGALCRCSYEGNQLNGVATLTCLQWESEFFGLPMAELHLLIGPGKRKETAVLLLKNVLRESNEYNHVMLRLDAQDFDVRFAAEDVGFRVMDTLCSYEFHPDYGTFPSEIKRRYAIRRYEPRDRDSLLAIASGAFFVNRGSFKTAAMSA